MSIPFNPTIECDTPSCDNFMFNALASDRLELLAKAKEWGWSRPIDTDGPPHQPLRDYCRTCTMRRTAKGKRAEAAGVLFESGAVYVPEHHSWDPGQIGPECFGGSDYD